MRTIIVAVLFLIGKWSFSQTLYFPPVNNNAAWDTISPATLGWCGFRVDSLYNFLQRENTKAFIVLKDGKIVLEKYFGTFTQDSMWYWASAGKTITSFLAGKAQEEGYLSINDTSSKYLGLGWTNCTPAQESKITIRNQLTMTSGLNDGVPDNHCTIDTCLNYLADAGTRWAYHNAPYTLLDSVIRSATGQTLNAYTTQKLKQKTGMTGIWIKSNYDNVFYSKARSMARFGLLIQNNCIWNTDTLLYDTAYKRQMVNTSQNLNKSYGYLWWLNGKSSFMVPTSQFVFQGSYAPDAPADMFAGIGKNGQFVSISRSKGLLFVRMGESPSSSGSEVPFVLCNQIWQKLNQLNCTLPLQLLSFKAKLSNSSVRLLWDCANEYNMSSYKLLRSSDGVTFNSITSIPAKPSNALNQYSYTDDIKAIRSKRVYYKLQCINKDGSFTYSNLLPVELFPSQSIVILPNPASNQLTISGGDIKSVQLNNAEGKLMLSKNVEAGINAIQLNITNLLPGMYYLRIIQKDNTIVNQKFCKQ